MSHFTVIVLTKGAKPKEADIDNALKPYHEYDGEDWMAPYLVFHDCQADVEKKFAALSEEDKKKYPNIDVFATDYEGDVKDAKTGHYGYMENPNAKWDWFEIGGRWYDAMPSVNGGTNSAKLSEVNFGSDPAKAKRLGRWWDLITGVAQPKTEDEKEDLKFQLYRPEYYTERYKTKENYVAIESCFRPYALLGLDGKWYAPGEMGWFGCSSETDEQYNEWATKFLDIVKKFNTDQDVWATLVDCHI